MKSSRLQFEYRKGASALHKKVGNLFRSGCTFAGQNEAYQEYPVNRVNISYRDSSHHFDWVILNLKVVVECHGKQHYIPTAFDGNYEFAVASFEELKARDKAKKQAALDAGFVYIEVPYTAKVNELWLAEAYGHGQTELTKYNKENEEKLCIMEEKTQSVLAVELSTKKKTEAKTKRKDYLASKKHQEQLKKAREFRQRRYRKQKELRKKNG